jgi:hypothetical protein
MRLSTLCGLHRDTEQSEYRIMEHLLAVSINLISLFITLTIYWPPSIFITSLLQISSDIGSERKQRLPLEFFIVNHSQPLHYYFPPTNFKYCSLKTLFYSKLV